MVYFGACNLLFNCLLTCQTFLLYFMINLKIILLKCIEFFGGYTKVVRRLQMSLRSMSRVTRSFCSRKTKSTRSSLDIWTKLWAQKKRSAILVETQVVGSAKICTINRITPMSLMIGREYHIWRVNWQHSMKYSKGTTLNSNNRLRYWILYVEI